MIEFKEVSKIYPGGVRALDGVSFAVAPGRLVCLVGPSGCGKTTTLKIINRLIEPTSGSVWVNARPVAQADPINLRRSMGYIIQGGGLMPHLTARRNVALLGEVKANPVAWCLNRADELLALVGLNPKEYAQRYPFELSGGQKQRVGIARALMADPPILLMDEPFGALDPITRSKMQREFLALNKKLRKTIVLVTHDLNEAFKLGDAIILMDKGRIVQQGDQRDFAQNPVNDFVSEFVGAQTAVF